MSIWFKQYWLGFSYGAGGCVERKVPPKASGRKEGGQAILVRRRRPIFSRREAKFWAQWRTAQGGRKDKD